MKDELTPSAPWTMLRQWTPARIAVGRVGASMPTQALLDFNLDHARARDAVHAALDVEALRSELGLHGFATRSVTSMARDRSEYLRRPDLGRRLHAEMAAALRDDTAPEHGRLTVVIGDGLSSLAPAMHALPLLLMLREALRGWAMDEVILATQARVALADEIGAARGAEAVLMLLGERPGLKSPDSLGAYLTYRPRAGRMDSERNCVSNIRPEGLSYEMATRTLARLLERARTLQASGTMLKDDSDTVDLLPEG